MTSVPNHRPPLSGNKSAALWVLSIILLFSSCDVLKPVSSGGSSTQPRSAELEPIQGRRVYDPKTGTYVIMQEVPTEKMDTIAWKEISETNYPPIISKPGAFPILGSGNAGGSGGSSPSQPIRVGEQGSQILSSYNVAVMLPFLADRFNPESGQMDENSLWALHFASGMRLALEELSAQGANLNVTLHDTRASEQTTSELLQSDRDLAQAHLVIGPYRRENVALVANKVRNTNQVLVSPHSAASNVSDRNPNYIQVNPTLETHCQTIMRHAYPRHDRTAIVLVARDDAAEVARFQFFNDEYRRLNGLRDTARLQQLVIPAASATMTGVDLARYMRNNDTTVFILPTWADEIFVSSFLRKLDVSRAPYQAVVVYGMPQWMAFERIEFDYFERLNVHVTSSFYLDPANQDVRNFRRNFFDRFGDVPREEAFSGYSIARYFVDQLRKNGTRFQYAMERDPYRALHTQYRFERVVIPGTTGAEFPPIERWENKYLNVLHFRNYQFEPAY